jgi:hypothetical protein
MAEEINYQTLASRKFRERLRAGLTPFRIDVRKDEVIQLLITAGLLDYTKQNDRAAISEALSKIFNILTQEEP